MPIPRRFDRRPPERDETRINERIRVPQVRLIGQDNEQVGVLSRDDALEYARDRDLDLVEVAAEASPPVCKVLDYSKYKYEQEQKAKAARKHQKSTNVREIKMRPKIATGDYETKKGHVARFLRHQDKVKVTIMFRGRETTHPERGERLLLLLAEELAELGVVEQRPTQDGRNMTMVMRPTRKAGDEAKADGDAPAGGDAPDQAAATLAPQAAPAPASVPSAKEAAAAPKAEAPAPAAEAPAPREEAAPAAAPKAKAAKAAKAEPAPAEAEAPVPDEAAAPSPAEVAEADTPTPKPVDPVPAKPKPAKPAKAPKAAASEAAPAADAPAKPKKPAAAKKAPRAAKKSPAA